MLVSKALTLRFQTDGRWTPPLTPPEGRAMKRAFSRLADLGNKIEELAHFNKKHMGQLSHQSEDDSD